MSDTQTTPKDWRDTVFLPKTDFPMKAGLPQKEPGILATWQEAKLYDRLRDARRGREKFIFHDGPPYANGDMHIGHALNHILKDMVVRTQTLLGKDAPYVPGWDCHGLPIEWKVEEEYRKRKRNKDEVDPDEFRAECRAYAQKWVDIQREQLKRLGINADWDHPYLTMDFQAEATIVSELMKFAESDQLYRGAKPVMWSPVEKTALAEAEIEYEDITSTQIDVAFEIVEAPNAPELVGAHAVIWTTTPWTIPVNQALAYGPEIWYNTIVLQKATWDGQPYSLPRAQVTDGLGIKVVIAEDLALAFRDRIDPRRNGGRGYVAGQYGTRFQGSDLVGATARHPMHELGGFFANPRPFLPGYFVTTDAGTGLVHMAPDHGEDDFALCKVYGIDPVFVVGADGRYRENWPWLGGEPLSVINNKLNAPDGPICNALREANALLSARNDESTRHSYPHSWRSKAKVIYRCTPQWFVSMDKLLSGGEEARVSTSLDTNGVENIATQPPFVPSNVEGQAPSDTLRHRAMTAIANTKFIPEKGRNRLGSMVEGRPDWVLSRQRAWGVPITLFVDRKTGKYLCDASVNARIIAAVREGGVDAWSERNAFFFLNGFEENDDPSFMRALHTDNLRKIDDYERVTDILDVWFDSGCTHAFVLESGRWPDLQWPADLYLEGSDQHRGWFQSSLLESCGTRGRAPYKTVLTHGFTMDQKGMKMSKSLGNTINPLDLMRDYGADILRLWALSVDFTEDHRIGDEILKGVADQYRKLRNSFRYLLGALEGFDEAERVAVAEMPELERYMLHLLAELDAKLRTAVSDFDFNSYTRLLSDFANNDLSAFYFDIRKDSLYCDAPGSLKRRACRTVFDTMFHALVRYAAPVLVFTAEEVWQTRYPDSESVHLLEWPVLEVAQADATVWAEVRALRTQVNEAIEPLRRDKLVRTSMDAEVTVPALPLPADLLAELFIVASVTQGTAVIVTPTAFHKCGRCWRLLPEVVEDGDLCNRCTEVVA
ncbi:MAG: isoleucine--tRNA ligase [Sphingomonas sp.]|uniref:isoleucine--tRNA ligase n=1 Tax=Sphingomonas sp. TaxID=28214 RepID=UPI0025CFAD4D|nr:isoleucine--tRNA ligase [Sphingomonas sp.]MBY0282699.1 isoleucine--tRNA ligase [Sphingomonas sp.]